jgi:hypothetical protein
LALSKKTHSRPCSPGLFFDGEAVVDWDEIVLDEINGMGVEKTAHVDNLLLIDPNSTGFTAATIPGQVSQASGSKPKSNPSLRMVLTDVSHFLQRQPGLDGRDICFTKYPIADCASGISSSALIRAVY